MERTISPRRAEERQGNLRSVRGLDWKDEELIDGKCLSEEMVRVKKIGHKLHQRSEHCQPMGGQLKNIFSKA